MRKIYMIESVPAIAERFAKALSDMYEVRICNDTGSVLKELDSFRPDLLVIDMSIPGLDAFSVVDHAYLSGIRPKVVASTVYWYGAAEERLARCNAGTLLLRPFTVDYLIKAASDILLGMETGEQADIRRIANELLLLLGLRLELQGYRYVLEAVVYTAFHMDCMICGELYPEVAKRCGVSWLVVERDIRSCIEKAWLRRDDQAWNLYFPKDHNGRTRHLTNSAFLKRIAFAVVENYAFRNGRKMAE